ncbi:hypothetical protein [Persicobacter sp. CCB-QB2]|uniref:hypothetical protein n=1 Tax=Persicobacter sp. CCB-QB2 TaxID=1561025 RepID=UPI0006A9C09E|nr:hypothetical protein [Persicobacter sp. CCB-QB2]
MSDEQKFDIKKYRFYLFNIPYLLLPLIFIGLIINGMYQHGRNSFEGRDYFLLTVSALVTAWAVYCFRKQIKQVPSVTLTAKGLLIGQEEIDWQKIDKVFLWQQAWFSLGIVPVLYPVIYFSAQGQDYYIYVDFYKNINYLKAVLLEKFAAEDYCPPAVKAGMRYTFTMPWWKMSNTIIFGTAALLSLLISIPMVAGFCSVAALILVIINLMINWNRLIIDEYKIVRENRMTGARKEIFLKDVCNSAIYFNDRMMLLQLGLLEGPAHLINLDAVPFDQHEELLAVFNAHQETKEV